MGEREWRRRQELGCANVSAHLVLFLLWFFDDVESVTSGNSDIRNSPAEIKT